MKLLTTVLVLWVGAQFTASVTSGETCGIDRENHYTRIECHRVSRETIFNGVHPLTAYKIISIKNSTIDPLGPEEWSALSHAVNIYIEDTDLKDLPAVGFKNFPCLKWLIIINNLIEVIPRGAFTNTIDATDSHCSNDGSTTVSRLEYLALESNEIHTIEDNSLMAASLKILHLNNNKIKDIDGKFKFLSGLQILSLYGNKIERLEQSSIQGLINLKYLYLDNNAITQISDDAFYHTKRLKRLSLDNNRITSLGWILRKNHLSTVPKDLFMALPGLDELYLRENPLQCSEELSYLQQKFTGRLYIDDVKCRPSPTVTNEFATNNLSNLQTSRHFDMFSSPVLVTNATPRSTESRKSTDVNFPSTRNTTESRKSTDVNFPSTRSTTESRKSTHGIFPSTRNTTESRQSTDVNFPSTPDDSSRSQTTATTAIVIIVTLLVVCVVCAVTVFVLWRRKKNHGKEEIASQPTPVTAARYSSTGGVALALGLRDA
ncbi:leucine-rich repeat-containing protein 15-like [Elysia marginata]|uniref:Leucine-rich repeat-containing protein 15-like n=1 Tax=Elysia marginata TaxID=1093978 RepID=A0AAV4EJD2_9GAST|nr:leucine-rich repeat-containing protein 15-like [Elysia marginata]